MSSPSKDAAPHPLSATAPEPQPDVVVDAVIDGQPARLVLDGHRDDVERYGAPEVRRIGGGLTALIFRRPSAAAQREHQQREDEADAAWIAQARGERPRGRFQGSVWLNAEQASAFDDWAATQDGARDGEQTA